MNDENNTRKCCKNPYTHLEIQGNGNCYFCCPSFIKNEVPIGNIFEQSFEEVWYGEKATEFRKSVLDGSYSKCDLTLCPFDAEGFFFYEDYLYPPYPKFVALNYKEMPRFVKMAQKFGATPVFWRFRKWDNASEMNRNYEKYTVWEKDHKDYKKFLKVMKKLQKIDVKICFHDPLFQKLYDQKRDTWLDKLKNIIFRR